MKKELLNPLIFRLGARAYDLLTGHDHWRAQIGEMLERLDGLEGPVEVLDLGCGPGVSVFALAESLPAGSRVTGLDLSPEMLARARRHHRRHFGHLAHVSFVEADATALPFATGRFDLITGHSFLYLVPDPVGVLREARRVLRPGGRLVFMEPSRSGSLSRAVLAAPDPVGALRQAPWATVRFGASMVLWRLVSGIAGRLDPERLDELFNRAAFESLECTPTLGGLGLHVVAR